MLDNMLTIHIMIALITISISSAQAAATWIEARNDAMGGAGIASSNHTAAALANPALMTKYNTNLKLILPAFGFEFSDPDNIRNDFLKVKDSWGNFKSTLGTANGTVQASSLKKELQNISGNQGSASAGFSMVMVVPDETLPFAFVVKSWGHAKVRAIFTDHDLDYLDAVASGSIIPLPSDFSHLTSRAEGMAALVSEYGIAMGHMFMMEETPISVGITPKYQRVDTWNYNVIINNFSISDFRSSVWRRSESGANIDLGISAELSPQWTFGLVGYNLIKRDVNTREVNGLREKFQVRSQAALGISWSDDLITLATDIDLTPTSGFASDKKAKYVHVGAELDLWPLTQLRAGYRANINNSDQNVFTMGMGYFLSDGIDLDVASMVGKHRNYGAVTQLTITF